MRAAIALAPVALLATSCGGKSDPYAASIAKGSEHVKATGVVLAGGTWVAFTESGDFTNNPDRGRITLRLKGQTFHQVVTSRYVYMQQKNGTWKRVPSAGSGTGPQTPAQIFRTRPTATIIDGLVRHIELSTDNLRMSLDFTKYGEPVSITVPRVKGSK
jgi:hypothetical protein